MTYMTPTSTNAPVPLITATYSVTLPDDATTVPNKPGRRGYDGHGADGSGSDAACDDDVTHRTNVLYVESDIDFERGGGGGGSSPNENYEEDGYLETNGSPV